MSEQREIWKTVPFGQHYEASSFGRVRKVGGRQLAYIGKIMAQRRYGKGYLAVSLYYDGRQHTHGVHRVVCAAFHGVPQGDWDASHLDGSKDNNRPENLRWVSHVENCAHKKLHGTAQSGERNPSAKLSASDIAIIRSAVMGHGVRVQLASRFGISTSSVSQIRAGKSWADAELVAISRAEA